MASLYEFIIKDKSGNTLTSLTGVRQRSWEIYLNKAGSASFSLSVNDPKALEGALVLGSNELYVYRSGTLVWGGELNYYRANLPDDTVTVTAKGFFDLLAKKVIGTAATPRLFTNTDLSTIAMTIINEAQTGTNASFGITQGSLATSRQADRTYEYKNVKDAIEGLSNENVQNGFDFEVAANKQFSTFYPKRGRDRNDIVFEYGKNIISFSETQDATEMANQAIVLGEGMGPELATVTRNTTIASLQETYKIRQKAISAKDVKDTPTLNDHGDKELSLHQTQQQIIMLVTKGNLDPGLGSYSLGDSVRIVVKYGFLNINQLLRVVGIRVRISDEDDEEVELIFNK